MFVCYLSRKGISFTENSRDNLVAGGQADDSDSTVTLPSISRPINHYVDELFKKGYYRVFVRISGKELSCWDLCVLFD